MKIALTGAAGQLGSFFNAHLKQTSIDFDAYKRHDWDILSKEDSKNLLNSKNYDVLINCAAYTDVEKAEKDQTKCMDINANALIHLSERCKKHRILLVHFSTDYIFDGESQTPYQETDKPNPLNVYGASKLAGEKIIQASGCRYLIGRVSWLFGGKGAGFTSKLDDWQTKNKVLKISSDEVSTPTYAGHVPRSIIPAIHKKLEGIFHVNNSGRCSRYEWASYYARQKNWHDTVIEPVPMSSFQMQAKRPCFSVLCNKRFQAMCATSIPHWEKAVNESIQP
jgi:dTDP-4-dehydrorhamnose reductase